MQLWNRVTVWVHQTLITLIRNACPCSQTDICIRTLRVAVDHGTYPHCDMDTIRIHLHWHTHCLPYGFLLYIFLALNFNKKHKMWRNWEESWCILFCFFFFKNKRKNNPGENKSIRHGRYGKKEEKNNKKMINHNYHHYFTYQFPALSYLYNIIRITIKRLRRCLIQI